MAPCNSTVRQTFSLKKTKKGAESLLSKNNPRQGARTTNIGTDTPYRSASNAASSI